MNAQIAMSAAIVRAAPAPPPTSGGFARGAMPAATSAATSTPARPSPATSPDAARMPGSASSLSRRRRLAFLDPTAHAAADVDRRHRGERQVHADREREAGRAAEHSGDREPAAGEHEPPRQLAGEHALDDRLHQHGLRRRDLLRPERVGAAEQDHRSRDRPARDGRADQLSRAAGAPASRRRETRSSGPGRCLPPSRPRWRRSSRPSAPPRGRPCPSSPWPRRWTRPRAASRA